MHEKVYKYEINYWCTLYETDCLALLNPFSFKDASRQMLSDAVS